MRDWHTRLQTLTAGFRLRVGTARIGPLDIGAAQGRRAPVPQQTINRIEHGERPVKFEEALAIADLLGVTVASLSQHISDEGTAAAAAEIQRAKIIKARTEDNIVESRDAWQRSESWARHMIEVQEQRIREAEQQLRDNGAVQDDNGRWHLNGAVIDV